MYLTYVEYLTMGGTLDEPSFVSYCADAEAFLDYVTFNRLQKYDISQQPQLTQRRVREFLISIINILIQRDNSMKASEDGNIVSQSNDGVSVQYNVLGAQQTLDFVEREKKLLVSRYLSGLTTIDNKRLLFRGIYPDE